LTTHFDWRTLWRETVRTDVHSLTVLLVAAVSMLAFGTGLLTLCLPDEPGGPAYYDGDDDDAGMVSERVTGVPQLAVVHTLVPSASLAFANRAVPRASSAPPLVFRPADLFQRAPPLAQPAGLLI
jgi:hypothetical protein